MSDTTPRFGNPGVPVGCILVLAGFVLPWLAFGNLSGLEIGADPEKAATAAAVVRSVHRFPPGAMRMLYFVPLLALSTLLLDVSVPVGNRERTFARLGVLVAGGTLTLFFLYVGIRFLPYLASGFWGSCMGSLFILVGGIFNAARRE